MGTGPARHVRALAQRAVARVGRRDFLANAAVLVALVPGAGLLASYVLRFLVPGLGEPREEVLAERLSQLPIGDSRALPDVLGNDLIVVRMQDGGVRVFSSTCTHLGCRVQWDAVHGNFLCPCHMGRFDAAGNVLAGPPPTPLESFPARVDGDNVFVTVPVRRA
jgi:cytochrome b6-f complex iron-sulfur subunit